MRDLSGRSSVSRLRTSAGVTPLRIVAWIATAQLAGLVLVCSYLWVSIFYFGHLNAVFYLSWRAADRLDTGSVPLAIGVHTFSDFLLPFQQSLVANPWTDYHLAAQPYPSGLVTLFKAITILPYGVALPLFLVGSAASMLVPSLLATRKVPAPLAIAACCLLVILTAPFSTVLDRGNVQGFLVIPFYIFARAWRLQQWRIAAAAIAAAAILKLYPLVLIVVFVAERKWKGAIVVVAVTVMITLGLFLLYPGTLSVTLGAFERALEYYSANKPVALAALNYSLVGMLTNATVSVGGIHSPLMALISEAPWLFGLAYLLLVGALLRVKDLPFVVRLALALTPLSQIVPISHEYSLVFVFVIVGELVREAVDEWQSGVPAVRIKAGLAIPLACALTLTLIPNPLPLPDRVSSVATILVPAAWTAFTLACAAVVCKHSLRRRGRAPAALNFLLDTDRP